MRIVLLVLGLLLLTAPSPGSGANAPLRYRHFYLPIVAR